MTEVRGWKRLRKPTITGHKNIRLYAEKPGEIIRAFWAEDEHGAKGQGMLRLVMKDGQLVVELFQTDNLRVIVESQTVYPGQGQSACVTPTT